MTFAEYKTIWDRNSERVASAYAKFQVACNGYNEATRKACFDDYLAALAWRDDEDRTTAAALRAASFRPARLVAQSA